MVASARASNPGCSARGISAPAASADRPKVSKAACSEAVDSWKLAAPTSPGLVPAGLAQGRAEAGSAEEVAPVDRPEDLAADRREVSAAAAADSLAAGVPVVAVSHLAREPDANVAAVDRKGVKRCLAIAPRVAVKGCAER